MTPGALLRPRWRGALGVGLVGLAALAGACRLTLPFSERLFFARHEAPAPRAADCERCHLDVYEEWSESLHAKAWTSPAFQGASVRGRASECLGCHAPSPLPAEGPPTVRDLYREEGVTCLSCHLSSDPEARPLTMRGPASRSSPVEVHPVFERDPLYRSSELCGRCHRGAFEEWQASPEPPGGESKATCQECHMPEVVRTVESFHPEHPYSAVFVALERKQPLRRHRFAVPEDADRHLRLVPELSEDGSELRVTVQNDLPHALPTGRFGRRELRLVAEWEGQRAEGRWVRALDGAIPARGRRVIPLRIPEGASGLPEALRLERWDHAGTRWSRLVALSREP